MARKFGGKFSPDGSSDGPDDRPHEDRPAYHGARVSPAGARSNVLFIPGVVLAILSINDGAIGMAAGLALEGKIPYVNTIATEDQPWFPGDEFIERRIRAFIRWNAAAMVINANKKADGIGGHLSTFASSAALYEVGFNWFFRGKDDGRPGDHVYFQGHAAPGVYARAYLERRLDEHHLDGFRMEIAGGGLSSYPHPRLMPDFWEFPTVSMGLGPINSIYHARFNQYLEHRRVDDTGAGTGNEEAGALRIIGEEPEEPSPR